MTVPPAQPTVTVTAESPVPTVEACQIVADQDVIVHSRPSEDASVFGTMAVGTRVVAEGRTPNGWLGFEPGVAQAANVGIFRLRWVKENEDIRLVGECEGLPVLEGPPAGVCFTMPMVETAVHAEPDEAAAVIVTMAVGEYASVTGRMDGWARVDLSVGNTGREEEGWVREETLNLNGPCEDLPMVNP
ncbi:MAG: hypothetical protein U9R72_14895 [Chloroflexota bacterium]|nr:hypothetical protein [Chloroflexota bacterium]